MKLHANVVSVAKMSVDKMITLRWTRSKCLRDDLRIENIGDIVGVAAAPLELDMGK